MNGANTMGTSQMSAGWYISEPVVPAGALGAEGTGVGWQVNTAVALPVDPMVTLTGLLWGMSSFAQPGGDKTEGQEGTVTCLPLPSHVVALTLALGPKPSMPLGAMAAWPRSRGCEVAPTFRSAAPAKEPVEGRYKMVATMGGGGHPPPQHRAYPAFPNHFSGMWWLAVGFLEPITWCQPHCSHFC